MNKRASISAGLRADASGWKVGLDRARAETARFKRDTEKTSIKLGGGGGATNAGMGMLMLSQGLDDLQYGFKGIVNNIAPLTMALGGSSGLAGALTIAAVAFNQVGIHAEEAWDKMTGEDAMKEAKKNAAVMEEMHANNLKRLQQEAGFRGEFQAKLSSEVEAANDRFRANHAAEIRAKQESIDLEAKLSAARISGLDPISKAAAEAKIEQKATADKLALEAQMYKERLASGKGLAEEADKRRMKLEAEKQKLETEPYLGPKGKARLAELPGAISDAKTTADAETSRRREDTKALNEVKRKQSDLPKEAAITDAVAFQAKADEAVKDGIRAAVEVMEGVRERAKEANDADKKAAEKAKSAAELKANEESSLSSRMARHMGKNRKADKIDDKRKVDDLVKGGLDKNTAEDLVRREREQSEDEALGPRRRKLRNLKPKTKDAIEVPAGPVMPLNIKPKKGDAPAAEKAGADSGQKALTILDRIEQNTRKTAAEQQQPAKRS